MDPLVEQPLQIVGALLILAVFILTQLGVLDPRSYAYLVPNAIGSAILCVIALLTAQWGFVLLEGVWALVSVSAIARRAIRRRRPATRADA